MLDRALHSREVVALGVFIDDAIAASVRAYIEHRDGAHAQAERRYAEAVEEASRRKDEFLAVLGHELRNPLAPIATSIQVIRTGLATGLPDAVQQSLEIIERQTSQLSRLVDDMLDLARIAQGQFDLRKSRVTLAAILAQAELAAASVMKARGHCLHSALPEQSLVVDADPDRLLQMIANLLNNAAKYTPPGGDIFLTVQEKDGSALIRVRDTGIGIPANMLSRVFDLFTQVDGAQQYAPGGLGIGLTLVKRLVEQHGGSISCASEGSGTGSEFVLCLPLATGAMCAELPSDPSAPAQTSTIRIVTHKRPLDAC